MPKLTSACSLSAFFYSSSTKAREIIEIFIDNQINASLKISIIKKFTFLTLENSVINKSSIILLVPSLALTYELKPETENANWQKPAKMSTWLWDEEKKLILIFSKIIISGCLLAWFTMRLKVSFFSLSLSWWCKTRLSGNIINEVFYFFCLGILSVKGGFKRKARHKIMINWESLLIHFCRFLYKFLRLHSGFKFTSKFNLAPFLTSLNW